MDLYIFYVLVIFTHLLLPMELDKYFIIESDILLALDIWRSIQWNWYGTYV